MTPITEEWLRESGFRWHQLDNQPGKQWVLWLGDICCARAFGCFDDLGIELAANSLKPEQELMEWFCWLRADYSHRYSRFLHVRHLKTCEELIAMIEGITGQKWDPANNLNGCMLRPEQAARLRKAHQELEKRLDVKFLQPNWRDTEKDESRGRPLVEHVQAAIDGGKAK